MSVHTPIFPHTESPPSRTNSSLSAATSTSAGATSKHCTASYSSRLSHWHLAIATLPEELCPPSAPSSPTSVERARGLQLEIEHAVRDKRYVGDLCQTRSARLGYATTQQISTAGKGVEGLKIDIPYVLAETEEEWVEWEEMARERRAVIAKGKEHETLVPPKDKSQSTLEKVLSWKVGLEQINASMTPSLSQQIRKEAGKKDSPLGFPVVKRSTVLKDSKSKTSTLAVLESNAESSDSPDRALCPTGGDCDQIAIDTHPETGPGGIGHGDAPEGPLAANNEAVSLDLKVIEGSRLAHLPDLSEFPPSFPPDLPSSTPKSLTEHTKEPIPVGPGPRSHPSAVSESQVDSRRVQQPPFATPPSPPASADSPDPNNISNNSERERAPSANASLQPRIMSPQIKNLRPLTPPPEAGARAEPVTQRSPHTPDRQALKKHKTMPWTFTPRRRPIDGPSTPVSSINGFRASRALQVPRISDHVLDVDLLATSRKSLPRPRPPSRKALAQQMNIDGADCDASDAGDPSPAKSDRSYFSSPASSDSSGSSLKSTKHVPSLPSSPLDFTQNPGNFAPMGESTQPPNMGARLARTPDTSRVAVLHAHLSSQHPGSSLPGLMRASSGLLGMTFNSQFDVEARLDRASHLLEKDVDFGAWVKETDDDDDEVRVEELTSTSPLKHR